MHLRSKTGFFVAGSQIPGKALGVSLAILLICAWMAAGQRKRGDFPKGAEDAQARAAEQSFAAYCAGCHGLDGKGGERAPDIVTGPGVRRLSDSRLLQILQKGVPRTSMPAFGHLGDQMLRSLLTHLRALQRDRTSAALSGDPQRGKKLFFGKAGCSGCHMVRGQGGFFGGDLTSYALGRSPDKVREAVIFPNRNLDPSKRTVVATLPGGETIQGIARNEDNFSVQLLTPDGTLHLLPKSALSDLSYRNESPMPADYGTKLSAGEIEDLVNYLFTATKETAKKNTGKDEPD